MSIQQIEQKIEETRAKIDTTNEKRNALCVGDYFTHEGYDEMLNDCYGEIEICGLSYDASYALFKIDKIAYRCGYNDWLDTCDITQVDDYIELTDELEELESELEELESELEELEELEEGE